MVILSQPILDFSEMKTCKATSTNYEIPVINLLHPDAKSFIVKACQEYGFFKVINHGVPMEDIMKLEDEAVKFFNLPQFKKENSSSINPFGYGNKKIGPNGDVGWIEYLLFSMKPEMASSQKALSICSQNSELIWSLIEVYVSVVKNMACEVLEMIADELKIEPKNILSKLLMDDKSDALFRLNHYPPCPELEALSGENMIGIGEHTDPQIISVLRSNNTSGLQIALADGTWVSVPSDQNSFFINVGDSLQVMTNGRFRSVKHRVLTDNSKSRISMIYFGAPPLSEKITPLSTLMEEGEESLYKEFTWSEYKISSFKTKLSDNRLQPFEKLP